MCSIISPTSCNILGESDPPDRQVSPEKLYRAALLRSRFADIIIKAQENTSEKVCNFDFASEIISCFLYPDHACSNNDLAIWKFSGRKTGSWKTEAGEGGAWKTKKWRFLFIFVQSILLVRWRCWLRVFWKSSMWLWCEHIFFQKKHDYKLRPKLQKMLGKRLNQKLRLRPERRENTTEKLHVKLCSR